MDSIDISLFRLINRSLANPFFDWLMPHLAWNSFFAPAVVLLALLLIIRGGARGRVFLAMAVIVTAIGDGVICDTLKEGIGRPRPFNAVEDARVLVGKGGSGSMPSSHAANWFAAATLAYLYYRKRWFIPVAALAALIGFSRVYLGVHYPSDVVVGGLLGVGYAFGIVYGVNWIWRALGRRWFPLWWSQLPSLLHPARNETLMELHGHTDWIPKSSLDQHWMRLGYALIFALFIARLAYIGSGKIELTEDEAYQWLWSKHLDLSYYSKPPLIAYTQFLGTSLWGDTAFGIRFFGVFNALLLSLLVFRFLTREADAQTGLMAILIFAATPLLEVGATLMTIDSLSSLFWTAAMITGWRAIQFDSTRSWLWTGLWLGLGFLSKYIALAQLAAFALAFLLVPGARKQWRRPGFYLAVGMVALSSLPVLWWNARHEWITMTHLSERSGLDRSWSFTLRFFWDFLFAQLALNPVFVAGSWAAAILIWKREIYDPLTLTLSLKGEGKSLGGLSRRADYPRSSPADNPAAVLARYLFCMGAPLFLFYLFYTLRARVQPNWIAPTVVPLFCLMILFWRDLWRAGARWVKPLTIAGMALGIVAAVLLHDTNLIAKIAGKPLPAGYDPLTRARGWKETARIVEEARQRLESEGAPAFVLGTHYGITSLMTFYMPEAKEAIGSGGEPLVYFRSSDRPLNQFYFWPGYQHRRGQNAILVHRARNPDSPPDEIVQEFESVKDLGLHEVKHRGRFVRTVQLFECRNFKGRKVGS